MGDVDQSTRLERFSRSDLLVMAGIVLIILLGSYPYRQTGLWQVVLVGLMAGLGALAWLRPVASGIAMVAVLVLALVTGADQLGLGMLAPCVALGAAMARGARARALALCIVFLVIVGEITAHSAPDPASMVRGLELGFILLAVPLLIGHAIHLFRVRATQARDAAAAQAAEERRALARNMHDTIVHATTAMVMRAESARVRGGQDPDTARDLEFICRTGRECADDLRALLTELRRDDEPDGPARSVREVRPLRQLVDHETQRLREHDFEVKVGVNAPLATIPSSKASTLGMVLTESVSNVCKYGDPDEEVKILIDADHTEVEACIINGVRAGSQRPVDHVPLGLVGLSELVDAQGGRLVSNRSGGHWMTLVSLPMGE